MRLLPLALTGALTLLALPAPADPLDLADPRPRFVTVEFEVSPGERPDQLDSVYTPPLRARLEPLEAGLVQVRVPAADVERHLLVRHRPKPGSFSDFVWVFDTRAAQVVSAHLTGTLVRRLDWGFFATDVEAEIRVEMSTRAVAGFRPPRRVLGNDYFGYCDRPGRAPCTLVPAVGYDGETGYVNAVGGVSVRFLNHIVHSFSPLGEAVFSELPRPVASR